MARRVYRDDEYLIIFARKYPPSKSCMICSASRQYQKLSNARDVTSRLIIFENDVVGGRRAKIIIWRKHVLTINIYVRTTNICKFLRTPAEPALTRNLSGVVRRDVEIVFHDVSYKLRM